MMRVRPHPAAVLAAVLFTALSCLVVAHDTVSVDRRVQSFFVPGNRWSHWHQVASDIPDVVSWQVQIVAFAVLVAALAVHRRSVRPMLVGGLLVCMTAAAVVGVKYLVARPDTGGHMTRSYPSGHMALIVITVGGLLLLLLPRTRWWQWVAVSPVWAGMAGCLLYGNIHWVTDVMGGALLGWALLGVIGMLPDRTGISVSRAAEPVVGTAR